MSHYSNVTFLPHGRGRGRGRGEFHENWQQFNLPIGLDPRFHPHPMTISPLTISPALYNNQGRGRGGNRQQFNLPIGLDARFHQQPMSSVTIPPVLHNNRGRGRGRGRGREGNYQQFNHPINSDASIQPECYDDVRGRDHGRNFLDERRTEHELHNNSSLSALNGEAKSRGCDKDRIEHLKIVKHVLKISSKKFHRNAVSDQESGIPKTPPQMTGEPVQKPVHLKSEPARVSEFKNPAEPWDPQSLCILADSEILIGIDSEALTSSERLLQQLLQRYPPPEEFIVGPNETAWPHSNVFRKPCIVSKLLNTPLPKDYEDKITEHQHEMESRLADSKNETTNHDTRPNWMRKSACEQSETFEKPQSFVGVHQNWRDQNVNQRSSKLQNNEQRGLADDKIVDIFSRTKEKATDATQMKIAPYKDTTHNFSGQDSTDSDVSVNTSDSQKQYTLQSYHGSETEQLRLVPDKHNVYKPSSALYGGKWCADLAKSNSGTPSSNRQSQSGTDDTGSVWTDVAGSTESSSNLKEKASLFGFAGEPKLYIMDTFKRLYWKMYKCYSPVSLVMEFKNQGSLSNQIWAKHQECQLPVNIFTYHMDVWKYISIAIQDKFASGSVFITGSSVNGLGLSTSDIDLCVIARQRKGIPDYIDSKIHLETIKHTLRNFAEVENLQLIEAKVPILKFTVSGSHSVSVDLNCNYIDGISNSQLLYSYTNCDQRLQPLHTIIKLWASKHGVNEPVRTTFSSYTISLLVIQFLQHGVTPAVLPCLNDYIDGGLTLDDLKCHSQIDMTRFWLIDWKSKNEMSLEKLLIEFFNYYKAFDFVKHVISVRHGCPLTRTQYCAVYNPSAKLMNRTYIFVEEPFSRENVAYSVHNLHSYKRIKSAFAEAVRSLGTSTNHLDSLLK